LGHTVLYGEYLTNNNGANFGVCGPLNAAIANCNAFYDNDLKVWGLGVVQEIDAAAMSLWLSYRHLSFNDNYNAVFGGAARNYEDFQYVKFGGLINF
jgi:hypothetical protein